MPGTADTTGDAIDDVSSQVISTKEMKKAPVIVLNLDPLFVSKNKHEWSKTQPNQGRLTSHSFPGFGLSKKRFLSTNDSEQLMSCLWFYAIDTSFRWLLCSILACID